MNGLQGGDRGDVLGARQGSGMGQVTSYPLGIEWLPLSQEGLRRLQEVQDRQARMAGNQFGSAEWLAREWKYIEARLRKQSLWLKLRLWLRL